MSGAFDFLHETVVKSDGSIRIPLIGPMKAGGLSAKALESGVEKELAEFVPGGKATVTVKKPAPKQIVLTGRVKSPGAYLFDPSLTCFQFVSRTGGFLNDADK